MPPDASDVLSSRHDVFPITRPADHMEKFGVHPHISHEHDVPKLVRQVVAEVDRLGRQIEVFYDADKNTTWRDYAKLLATLIKNQRGELKRLHKKVRELRADVHERDERIAALEAISHAPSDQRASVDPTLEEA